MKLPPVPAPLCVILCFLCFLLGTVFGVGLLFHEAATRSGNPTTESE
jgi:hypothetical protein